MIIKKNSTPKDHLLELIEKGDKKYIHFLALYQYNYILEHLLSIWMTDGQMRKNKRKLNNLLHMINLFLLTINIARWSVVYI